MDDPGDGAYSRAPEPEDVVRLCRALNEAGALYADVAADAEDIDIGGVLVKVASPRALIRTKDTKRPQDAMTARSSRV